MALPYIVSGTSKKKVTSSIQEEGFLEEEEEEIDSDQNDDNLDADKMIKVYWKIVYIIEIICLLQYYLLITTHFRQRKLVQTRILNQRVKILIKLRRKAKIVVISLINVEEDGGKQNNTNIVKLECDFYLEKVRIYDFVMYLFITGYLHIFVFYSARNNAINYYLMHLLCQNGEIFLEYSMRYYSEECIFYSNASVVSTAASSDLVCTHSGVNKFC